MTAAGDLSYREYLRLDELLSAQHTLTGAHDELMFVIMHQINELWFKLILHETALLQHRLEAGNGPGALATARRVARILRTVVGHMDILETMTPWEFARFRRELGTASGFQSSQFRHIEAAYGRRGFSPAVTDPVLDLIVARRPVFGSLLCYLRASGWDIPDELLYRDPRAPWQPDERVQALLAGACADSGVPAEVCEALIDIDEEFQEWRYRHMKMVERIIGTKPGTGGTPGAAYLRGTLLDPAFPDLWAIRSRV